MTELMPNPEMAQVVRQIMLSLLAKNVKFIAIAPPRARASAYFVTDLCSEFAAAGMTVVHLQLDPPDPGPLAAGNDNGSANGPVDPDDMVSEWWPQAPPQQAWRLPNQGVLRLRAPANPALRQTYNNPAALRQGLEQAFGAARAVVLELAPVLGTPARSVSPVAAAAGCDGVVLICPLDEATRSEVREAEAVLTAAGARMIGTVLDETKTPPALVAIAKSLSSWRWIAPQRISRLQDWLVRSSATLRH